MAATGMISNQIHIHPNQRFEPSSEEYNKYNYYNSNGKTVPSNNARNTFAPSKSTLSPLSLPKMKIEQSLPVSPPQTPKPPSGCNKKQLTVSARHLENYNLHSTFASKYCIGEELGSGGFGFVISAIQKSTRREVAVKFIFREKVPAHAWANDTDLGMIPMEIYVLKNVKHPSIIAFLDAYQDARFFYLVMELHGTQWSAANPLLVSPEARLSKLAAVTDQQQNGSGMASLGPPTPPEEPNFPPIDENGQPRPNLLVRRTSCDLFECIEHHSKFSENLSKKIFRQIIECVSYLNDIGVCHRDIKDENIVIDNNYVVKLVDFGSAVILPRSNAIKPHYFDKFYGTISFASPEILLCKPYCAEPAEIWSLGILLYTVLTGEVPFNDPQQAISGPYAPPRVNCTQACLDLLERMLEKNPEKRATVAEVMDHPWFREN
ncbi:hypothetical protein INT43_001827 [Umbelopsis isabellina]|uniref:Protein kinase domain-containing protein n=1 Tax=Mortierella isabellina TaxID=91625 RepID=A0A8H7PSB8_MORIS|nr:hypothetical protein INT43_001827 [Umbelopsis isabellina]